MLCKWYEKVEKLGMNIKKYTSLLKNRVNQCADDIVSVCSTTIIYIFIIIKESLWSNKYPSTESTLLEKILPQQGTS